MADLSVQREVRAGGVHYLLEGVFTGQAAYFLKGELAHERGRVVLDFSRVQRFFDFGLAAFATELRSAACAPLEVELVGLGLHHRRLLAYFGLATRAASEPLADELLADPPPAPVLAPA